MKKRFIMKLAIICIASFALQNLSAQQRITFQIKDKEHVAADAASIVITDTDSKRVVRNGIADTLGEVHMQLDKGHYSAYISSLGYKDTTLNFTIPHKEQLIKITIQSEVAHLADIIITAKKHRPTIKMEDGKVNIDVAQSYLADIGNAIDVLKHSPGIHIDNKGNISLSSLGGTAIYINGKKTALQGDDLAAYLRSLPSTRIQKISTSPNPNASYEAEGAGGIIDIVLKNNTDAGFHLTTSHGLSYWNYIHETSDVLLSYNWKHWQIGVAYNQTIGHYAMEYGSDRIQDGNRNLSTTEDADKRDTYSGNIDLVYQPNDKHKFTLNTSVSINKGPGHTSTQTQIYDTTNQLTQLLYAENDYQRQRIPRYSGNIAYTFTPNQKQTFSVNADYIHVGGYIYCNQPNTYYQPNGTLHHQDVYQSETDKHIDIASVMLDYKQQTDKGNELLAGVKASTINSDNDFKFSSALQLDRTRSNRFRYSERNLEGYLQYTLHLGKWMATAGMRLEYMHSKSLLRPYTPQTQDETNKVNRFGYFPNASVSYQATQNTRMTLAYSKRQDKPRYEDLNPFEYLLDELTYWKGNPFITPQTNHKFLFSLSHRQLAVTLSYNMLDNYFTGLNDVYDNNKIVMTTKNIGQQRQVGIEAVYSKRIASWWDTNMNLGAYYFVNKLDYESHNHVYRRPSYTLNLTNNITLPAKLRLEVAAQYRSKRQGGSYDVLKSSGYVNTSISRNFFNDRLHTSIILTDAFHTQRWDSYGHTDNLQIASWGHSETRQIGFKVRYYLGARKYNVEHKTIKEAERL
uniref:TonB-dependent receptor family protein n=1 Tax=Prevotella sp. GTC17259 TaxID=3236795 RepID=A0AB33J242_9BACT